MKLRTIERRARKRPNRFLFNEVLSFIVLCVIVFSFRSTWAASERNELPAPFNVQAVVLQKTITLTWQWPRPEELPVFTPFGFEVVREGAKPFFVTQTTYEDSNLAPGSYSYKVRVRGITKEKGKKVTYVSDWSEPVKGAIQITCARPPAIELTVEPTQKAYASVATLRFHIKGRVTMETGCTLGPVNYHLDTGTGITHGGSLPIDPKGHFDTFFNAFGPEDEIPSGHVSFAVTAAAANEAGPTTSSPYTIDVELQNPFAPH